MKKIIIMAVLVYALVFIWATQMIIEKTDGTQVEFEITEIEGITFEMEEGITITYPTESTSWTVGENISVQWNGGEGTTVDVFLYCDGTMVDQFNAGTANDGQINDLCPNFPTENARILIEDNLGNMGWSDYFTIVGNGSINITQPDENTVWTVGQTISVLWNNADGSTVDIYVYRGCEMVEQFNDGTANDGQINDACPDFPGNDIRILIEDDLGNYGWSEYFTISE
jgi:hypothetical protein